ncbi:Glutamate receptor ionotropic, delta-1 [Clonorchis sinensis]|uniref:Glutamate receptor ionotropic, delta-1 n=1 Tax=Clonorchis sinensis TaxID=79923 RepID=A0A8T1M409_CLOSI|nr:Glutamate receptor ionotropic, delta-1 [Clonorchis sinensis]
MSVCIIINVIIGGINKIYRCFTVIYPRGKNPQERTEKKLNVLVVNVARLRANEFTAIHLPYRFPYGVSVRSSYIVSSSKQLKLGVQLIISLTDCIATNLIVKQTANFLVSYVPIIFSNCRIQTTSFAAPIHVSDDRMAKAVHEVLLEAHAVYAGLLSNGPTGPINPDNLKMRNDRDPDSEKEFTDSGKSDPNFGFFRIFPVFQPKHCTSKFASYLMRLFASQVYACDLTRVPYISDSKLDSTLWFFSVQTLYKSAQVGFVPTVRIPTDKSATLTYTGSFIYQASGVSGVFANQFHSFHGALLRVGVIMDGLFVTNAIKRVNCELTNVSGLGVEILDAMAARFNFTYVLMEPFDSQYGVAIDGGNWTGLIGDLMNNRIDMAVGLLTLTKQRAEVVQFLGPFMKTHVVTAIAQPLDNLRLFQMYKPFRFHVWFTTALVMLLWAQITVLFNRYSSDSAWNRYNGEIASQEVSYLANLWAQIKAMVGQPACGFDVSMKLIKASILYAFQLSRNNDVYKKIYEMAMKDGIRVNDTCQGLQLVHRYRYYAFINDWYLLQTEMPLCGGDFILLDEKIDESPASFAVRKHAPYADIFTHYFWDLYQRGTIEHWIEKWLPEMGDRLTKGAAYRPLNVEAVGGGFVPLVCAMTLSLLALTVEIMWHHHRSRTHVAPLDTKSRDVDNSGSSAVNTATH